MPVMRGVSLEVDPLFYVKIKDHPECSIATENHECYNSKAQRKELFICLTRF